MSLEKLVFTKNDVEELVKIYEAVAKSTKLGEKLLENNQILDYRVIVNFDLPEVSMMIVPKRAIEHINMNIVISTQ